MADVTPERTWQPSAWKCIGTFGRMETSTGVRMGPGKVFVPGTEDPENSEDPGEDDD